MVSDEAWWHGTRRGYDRHRCRCEACRACNADRVRRWRASRPIPRRNWWRDHVYSEWFNATQAWQERREAVSHGYESEEREFEADNPRPRLADFMVHLAQMPVAA